MIAYLVTFEGKGFDLLTEDGQQIGGFFISVVASASDPKQAFDAAHNKLINSQAYQELVSSNEHHNGVLSVHGYSEITNDDLNATEVSGFVFYPHDEETGANSAIKH